MTNVFQNARTAASNRAKYRQTLRELRNLGAQARYDIGVDPADFERVAHQTVYGK